MECLSNSLPLKTQALLTSQPAQWISKAVTNHSAKGSAAESLLLSAARLAQCTCVTGTHRSLFPWIGRSLCVGNALSNCSSAPADFALASAMCCALLIQSYLRSDRETRLAVDVVRAEKECLFTDGDSRSSSRRQLFTLRSSALDLFVFLSSLSPFWLNAAQASTVEQV